MTPFLKKVTSKGPRDRAQEVLCSIKWGSHKAIDEKIQIQRAYGFA